MSLDTEDQSFSPGQCEKLQMIFNAITLREVISFEVEIFWNRSPDDPINFSKI
jgi:hypothetical protein